MHLESCQQPQVIVAVGQIPAVLRNGGVVGGEFLIDGQRFAELLLRLRPATG
jgi:hypothetical protein